jgi:hypothetical protein
MKAEVYNPSRLKLLFYYITTIYLLFIYLHILIVALSHFKATHSEL